LKANLNRPGITPRKAAEKKWDIRRAFHPQIVEACQTHPSLREAFVSGTKIPPVGRKFTLSQVHHSDPDDIPTPGARDLCAPIEVGGRKFMPIVRESLALGCALNIIFLRRENPGSLVLQGGDLDNRIKTLFDALRIPAEAEMVEDPTLSDPIHCLLESDTLITGINIRTDRLLTGPNKSAHEVHLVIEAHIQVLQAKLYNLGFLGE
jgi:hypothetical protein